MELPVELQLLSGEYLEKVRLAPDHQLKPHSRVQIYKMFQAQPVPIGERALQWLQIITTQKVLPNHSLPDKFNSEEVVQTAQGLLSNTISLEAATNKLDEIWEELPKINLERASDEVVAAHHVFCSAVLALTWAIKIPVLPKFNEDATDEDWLDFDSDSAGTAVAAQAGALWFTEGYDPLKSLIFWEWWLSEAIPQAWELAN